MSDGTSAQAFGGRAYETRSLDLARFQADDLDQQIAAMVREAWQDDGPRLEHLRGSISTDEQYTLLSFSRRRAADALRRGGRELASEAAMAFALVDGSRVDRRDISPDFALLAARETGADVAELIGSVMARSDARIARSLQVSLDRGPSTSIDSCALFEVRTAEHGLGFVEKWTRRRPSVDFVAKAVAVADAVDAEGTYAVDSITVSDLPGVWFDGPENLDDIATSGCVSIAGSHREARRPWSHGLLAFVAHADTEVVADLARRAADRSVQDRPRAAFAYGKTLAVLVGGSSTMGEGSLETVGSLQRFGPMLAAILG